MKNIINKALQIALKAHDHKSRIADDVPYVIHPIEVGMILGKNEQDDEVIAAGIIHDAVEDEFISLEEVEQIFGYRVKRIVEKVYIADKFSKEKNFRERKKYTIDYLREQASPEFKFVCCADKLSNVRIMLEKFEEIGDKVWKRYKQSYEDIRWYHQSLVVSLNKLYRYDLYEEYLDVVEKLFGEIPAERFINKNLETIHERFDADVANNTMWLSETLMNFLGKIISYFKINEDAEVHEDVREAMNMIIDFYNKQNNDEEINISENQWLDVVRVFYILRYFFKYKDNWIKENIGVNYLAWFKLYDERFKNRIV